MCIILIEEDLEVGGAVETNSLPLSDDVVGQHQVIKDGLMDCSEGSAVWSLLRLAELNDSMLIP